MNTWWHLVVRQQRNMMPTQWNKCSWFLEFRFLTFPVSWLYTWASCLLLKGTVCWEQEGYHRHYLLLSKVNLNVMCFQWNFNIDTEQHGKIRLGAGLTPPVYFIFNFLQKKKKWTSIVLLQTSLSLWLKDDEILIIWFFCQSFKSFFMNVLWSSMLCNIHDLDLNE